MIALALAALLYVAPADVTPTPVATPAPSVEPPNEGRPNGAGGWDPTPEPTPSVEPPNEGRPNGAGGWDPEPAVTPAPAAVPVAPARVTPTRAHVPARPVSELAETGVQVAPYLAIAAAMIATGAGLLEVLRRKAES